MKLLVTGSSGHLGEALVRTLRKSNHEAVGIDLKPSPYTTHVGSITDRAWVESIMEGVDIVYHTATLHKPHVATHSMAAFVETNIKGTLNLLEASVQHKIEAFIFTSTTSTFGDALRPPPDQPAVWVTESVQPIPRNIYGVTKTSAEDLCYLFHRKKGLPCIILRTSRFFPEEDDDSSRREAFSDDNLKVNEFLYRRVDLEDVVTAHLCAAREARRLQFGRYIISATSPFPLEQMPALRTRLPEILQQLHPEYQSIYQARDWKMLEGIDRVYVNQAALDDLKWKPQYTFDNLLKRLTNGDSFQSPLTFEVGSKGYHETTFEKGPYPVLED